MLNRKVYLFYIYQKPTIEFLNLKKNSLFVSDIKNVSSDSMSVMFQSRFEPKSEEITLKLVNLLDILENGSGKEWEKVVENAYQTALSLSKENMPQINEDYKSQITGVIKNALYKIQVMGKGDIFTFLADIFIKLNIGHILPNGNKRIATSTLINMLYMFGYYFKFWNNTFASYRKWEEYCKEIIKRNDNKEPIDSIVGDVRQWIINNIVVSINIRK